MVHPHNGPIFSYWNDVKEFLTTWEYANDIMPCELKFAIKTFHIIWYKPLKKIWCICILLYIKWYNLKH